MKPLASLIRTLLVTATVLLPTLAAQHTIGTAFGQTLQGTLLSDDGSTIKFRTDGGTEMTLPYRELDAQTIYRLMAARTAADDGPGQLKLGDQATAADLFDAARDAYARALAADQSLQLEVEAKLASLRIAASNSLLAESKHAAEHGRPDVAVHDLSTLMHEFPDEPAAQEGRSMLDSLEASQSAARSKAKAQAQSQAVQEALAPIESIYVSMGQKINQGLKNTGNLTDSITAYQQAISTGTDARAALQALQSQAATIPGLTPASQELDKDLVAQLVNAYTQLANAYNQRSAYNDADTAINGGLALEPKDQALLQLKDEIASNANQGVGIGFGSGGGVGIGIGGGVAGTVGVVGWHVAR